MKEKFDIDNYYPEWIFENHKRTLDRLMIESAREMRDESDSKPGSTETI